MKRCASVLITLATCLVLVFLLAVSVGAIIPDPNGRFAAGQLPLSGSSPLQPPTPSPSDTQPMSLGGPSPLCQAASMQPPQVCLGGTQSSASTAPAVYWDSPLQTGYAVIQPSGETTVSPGPEDVVRVIVEFEAEPAGRVRARLAATIGMQDTTATEQIVAYAEQIRESHSRTLAEMKHLGIGFELKREYTYLFNGLAGKIKMQDWQRLEQLPQVKAVYADYEMRVSLSDSVPLIGAPDVWATTDSEGHPVTGQGMRVAVLDTGVDYTHPDLGGGLGPTYKVIAGYDFVNDDTDPMDDNGHGTHVAGIVAASGTVTGVAPAARLLAYKVCDAYGACWAEAIIAGLERAVDPDGNPLTDDAAHVINLSLSGPGFPNDPVSQAVDSAVDQGSVVVVAAGNRGLSFRTLESPSVARKAFSVAASDKNDQLASFSSRGPVTGFFDILKPDITAPGVMISSTVPSSGRLGSPDGYQSLSGTSMAAPHVAGAAALIKQLHSNWSPEMVKANLMNTAADLDAAVYEQGAGRIRVAASATTPLVASPGSLSFGLPLIDGTTSAALAVVNVSTATVTTTLSISTVLWANALLEPLTSTVPVTYAQLSSDYLALSPETTDAVNITLSVPPDAPEGYYTGRVTLQGDGYTLSVPFAFTLLCKVTVHIRDENGVEFLGYADTHMVRVPGMEVNVSSSDVGFGGDGRVPTTYYVPSGDYNVHGYARHMLYAHVFYDWEEESPLILAATATVPPNTSLDIYLDATQAHHFVLDATTLWGDPLFIDSWSAAFRYQNDNQSYASDTGSSYGSIFRDTDLRVPLPTNFDCYISDTPEHTSFTFVSMGYGYSPQHLQFRNLNSAKWYEDPHYGSGFGLRQWADEVYLFEWQYPRIDASTPSVFAWSEEQVSQYTVRYDFPGTMDRPWLQDQSYLSGGDAVHYVPTDPYVPLLALSAGLERTIYLKGQAFLYGYWADDVHNDWVTEREFYSLDWSKAYTAPTDANVRLVSGWDLHPLPREEETITLGAGPIYPAVTFNNSASDIELIHPVLGSERGNKVYWGEDLHLEVYRDAVHVYYVGMIESWWSPSPMRQIPANDSGTYQVLITSAPDGQIAYSNTIEASFTLPSADMNPPRVTALEMPQRFAPDLPISATLTVTDAESDISGVEMCYSTDDGATWMPVALTQDNARYATAINPGGALTVSLAFTVTDHAGNYLAFTTLGAAIRETPVTLTLEISPTTILLSSNPFTVSLSGALRKDNDEPLSEAALPIAIYLNGQKAGYVRDVARLPDGTFEHGTIGFDWTFIPTDFITNTGTAELRFVFDMGTYARQEEVFVVAVTGEAHSDIPLEQGWNLVSLPLRHTPIYPRDLLAPIEGTYDLAYAWDSSTQSWLSFSPALPDPQPLDHLDQTTGLWLHLSKAAILRIEGSLPAQTRVPLSAGWNLVGFPSGESQSVESALASIAGQFTLVYEYDSSNPGRPWKHYNPLAPPYASTLTTLRPGMGYWIKATEPCEWVVQY